MWAGTLENSNILQQSKQLFEHDIRYNQYSIQWEPGQDSWYWEGVGRYLGTQQVSENTDYILYIDIDEIIDPMKFNNWIFTKEYEKYDSIKLASYWYWREPIYQSNSIEDSVVLAKAKLAKSLPCNYAGREQYFNFHNTIRNVQYSDPMIHHFSWVRSKDEMLNKVSNWGHNHDRLDWIEKVEEEFSRPFNGTDFLHKYTYKTVENIFNI
jgi:hypothetical protein